ncbi:hypothetical protein P692DRAFT_20822381 [Suillus brevipes Sb2]|nr:hypothetical protein P692DRAFT_20822381 [Suillus brevipes Sb2]
MYCFSKVYSFDPINVDALWDRASLAKEINDLRAARHSFLAILKRFSHDIAVLAELASLYQAALEHYPTVQSLGPFLPTWITQCRNATIPIQITNTSGMGVDDREYDLPREDLGNIIIERSGDIQPDHYPLDVNARHRLAIARIKLGDVKEGKMHASIVLAQDVLDYAALFGEIADSF